MADPELVVFDRYGAIVIATVHLSALDAQKAEAFGAALHGFVAEQPGAHLLVNLHEVRYLSSAALSKLIAARQQLEADAGSLRVCGAAATVYKVFEVTNLHEIFHCHQPWQGNVRQAAEHYIRTVEGAPS